MLSSPQDIRDIQIFETWIGGQRVFKNN